MRWLCWTEVYHGVLEFGMSAESDKPNMAKQYFADRAIQEAEFVLERIEKRWPQ